MVEQTTGDGDTAAAAAAVIFVGPGVHDDRTYCTSVLQDTAKPTFNMDVLLYKKGQIRQNWKRDVDECKGSSYPFVLFFSNIG